VTPDSRNDKTASPFLKSFMPQWFAVAVALLALSSTTIYDVMDDRNTLISNEQQRLMTQARVIEMNLAAQVQSIALTLRSMARHQTEAKDIGHRLGELSDAMPGARTLVILDKSGRVTSSNIKKLIKSDFSKRDYFSIPRLQPDNKILYISPPFKSVLNSFVLTMSVIIPDKNGGFNGVAGATLDPDYFTTLLKSVIYADNMWGVIMHGNGLLFMMIPETKAAPGKNLAIPGTFYTRHTTSGRSENIFTGSSYPGNEQRIVAIRTFNPPQLKLSKPLIIAVSRDLDRVLAGWWRDTIIKCSAVLLAGVFLVFGTLIMQSRQRKLDQQSQQLLAEQITARQELIRSQETQQYTAIIQGILESTSSAVFSVDTSFNYTSFNLAHALLMKELYNGNIEIGANLPGYMPDDHAVIARANLKRTLAGESFIVEAAFENLSGKKQYFEISHNPIINADGNITGIAVFAFDTTERIETLNALKDSNELFELFMRYSPIYCFIKKVTADESRIISCSDNFEFMTGIPAAKMVGRTMDDIFPLEVARKFTNEDWSVICSHQILKIDEELNDRSYTTIKFPIIKEDSTLLAGFTIDITDRKQAEAEVLIKNKEIQQFIYTVSHDLRSPLITIKTFTGYLEQDLASANQQQITEDVQFISKAAEKMEILLNELLAMSRVGHPTIENSEMTFRQMAEEAAAALAGQISEKRVEIHTIDIDIRLYGDRPRLTQIWQNLLDNAIKYMGDQPTPLITIGAEHKFNDVVFYICDNGIGIAPQNLDKVFNIFEKLGQESSGVGMGLAMVKRIVELNGGRIWVESRGPCYGSCFQFTLPGAVNNNYPSEHQAT